jgi:DNA (cytosine-5)-methyltransferase 1
MIKVNPKDIQTARERAGLTYMAAGRLIYVSGRMWSRYENGLAPMHPAYWELFLRKTNQVRLDIGDIAKD